MRELYKTLVPPNTLITIGYWIHTIKILFSLFWARHIRMITLRIELIFAPLVKSIQEAKEGRGKLSVMQLDKFQRDGEAFLFFEGPIGILFAISIFSLIGALSILNASSVMGISEFMKAILYTGIMFFFFIVGIYISLHMKIKEERAQPLLKRERDLERAAQVEQLMMQWENLKNALFRWSFFGVMATYWILQHGRKFLVAYLQKKGLLKKPAVPVVKNFNLRDIERDAIDAALKHYNYHLDQAAEALEIDVHGLERKIKKYNIVVIRPLDGWWKELFEKNRREKAKPQQKSRPQVHVFSES